MQHNMSSNSFKGKMCLGSWQNTPLFPGLKRAADILAGGKRQAKDDQFEEEISVNVSGSEDSD